MKKNVLLAIIAIVILVVLVIIFVGVNNKTTENSPSSTSSGTSTEINGETQITLNQKTDIATLKDSDFRPACFLNYLESKEFFHLINKD